VGCSSSPTLCGKGLKALRGRSGAAYEKPSDNIGEEALTDASASRIRWCPPYKLDTSNTTRRSDFLSPINEGVSVANIL